MRGPELTLEDSLGKFKVCKTFLVSLQHVHAASEVIVYSSCVDGVSSQALLSDLPRLEVASDGPGGLVGVEED
jgi:hypothetical protein